VKPISEEEIKLAGKASGNTRKWIRRGLFQVLVVALLAGPLVLLLTGGPSQLASWKNYSFGWLLLAGMMVLTAWITNGFRTWMIARACGHSLPIHRAIGITLSTEFGIASSPGGVGGSLIKLSLQKKHHIPYSTSSSMLAVDILADITFFTILLPFGISQIARQHLLDKLPGSLEWLGLVIPLTGFLAVALAIWKFNLILRLSGEKGILQHLPILRKKRIPARSRWLRYRAIRAGKKFRSQLGNLWKYHRPALFINVLLAGIQFSCRYGVLPILLIASGTSHSQPLTLFLIQGVIFMLALVIVIPGGGGGVEVFMAIILSVLLPEAAGIGALVLLWRFFTYHSHIIAGGLAFLFLLNTSYKSSELPKPPRLIEPRMPPV